MFFLRALCLIFPTNTEYKEKRKLKGLWEFKTGEPSQLRWAETRRKVTALQVNKGVGSEGNQQGKGILGSGQSIPKADLVQYWRINITFPFLERELCDWSCLSFNMDHKILVVVELLILCDSMDCSPPGSLSMGNFPGKNTGAGLSFPSPRDLPGLV